MSSTSEKGHDKNFANFNDLINTCTSFGPAYNPSKPSLQISAITASYTAGLPTQAAVISYKTNIQNIQNQREALFRQMPDRATRIYNALDATEASDALVRDARTHLNKIRGKRSQTTPPNPDNAAGQTISVSQRSYDKLLQHFRALVETILSEPTYTPNETELQAASLNAYITELQNANNAESAAMPGLSILLINRNQVLYAPVTGLCDLASEVKKYVKSAFGAQSPQYKLVSKIKFTKRKL